MRYGINAVRTALALFLIAAAASAQDARIPEETLLLARIKAKALEDMARLPNYACIETVERYRRAPQRRDFTLMDRMHIEVAKIGDRERFAWPGKSAFAHDIPADMVGHGASATGDFWGNISAIFSNPDTTFRYSGEGLAGGAPAVRYEYQIPARASGLTVTVGPASGRAGVRGSFWADPASLDVLRVETEAYDIPPEVPAQSAVSRTDYWRVRIGAREILLARRSEFVLTNFRGETSRNVIVFTNCREFSGQSTITFADGPAISVSAPPALDAAALPAGIELALRLDTAIDPKTAAAGTAIRARVLEASGGVPKGARVYGRVRRIAFYPAPEQRFVFVQPRRHEVLTVLAEHENEVLIGIEFTEIEYARRRAPFAARLIDVEPDANGGNRVVREFGYFANGSIVEYDLPGSATFYLSARRPVLPRGLRMQWITVEPRER